MASLLGQDDRIHTVPFLSLSWKEKLPDHHLLSIMTAIRLTTHATSRARHGIHAPSPHAAAQEARPHHLPLLPGWQGAWQAALMQWLPAPFHPDSFGCRDPSATHDSARAARDSPFSTAALCHYVRARRMPYKAFFLLNRRRTSSLCLPFR
jgi:hypothetical protein